MKKRLLITFLSCLLLGNSSDLFSQGLCDNGGGGFELDKYEGCAPLTVKIKNTVPNSFSVGYDISYDGQSQNPLLAQGLPSVTYYYAGNYTMLQGGSVSTGPIYACRKIKVFESRNLNVQYTSCGGGKIKLLFSDDVILQAYDKVEINWGDNTKDIWNKGSGLELEHNYVDVSISPVMKIKGLYNSNPACSEGTELSFGISFQQPLLKNIQIKTVEMKGNGSLEVTYEGVTSIATDILTSSDGGASYIVGGTRTSGGTQFYRVPNLNAAQVYQVKLGSKDLCGGQQDSEIVTSMVLKGVSGDEKNSISWNQYQNAADFQEYQLMRDGVVLKSFNDIKTISYVDEDVQCGDSFEYSVVAVTKTIQSISAPVIIKTTTTSPKPVDQMFVTVNSDDLIELNANIPGAGSKSNYEILIQRADGAGGTFKKVNTLYGETIYQDFDVQADKNSYCYRLIYQNACGQKAPVSEPVCSILLQNQNSLFTWTTEKPFFDEIQSYKMIQIASSGSKTEIDMKLLNNFAPQINKENDPSYTFQIRADSKNGNFQSYSNVINYKRDADIFVPSAFSPNEDGINDTFEVKVSMYKSFKMSVLNRWGEVIFHSNDITKGWDGMFKGEIAAVGSYIFNIEIVNNINQTVKKNGTFVLLK
ncbi:gliding motility-associated C-terminal domain-containing protein [Dyadobacter subterraneus]|uniref:Gliding motility-associated C-terminal domain-containing protein n=1 Tax=Dyadobacter subterraneus TaxID=2773304 RepID=A0ABR9WKT8_9BACT|nr:gliding motility-associated C-terminal domain-containing protein [Dyadobacter subterraneus]MBE9466122.1 gliding motility-associated C-terminal domain-containing protein [Dyadobacter subterraneus]